MGEDEEEDLKLLRSSAKDLKLLVKAHQLFIDAASNVHISDSGHQRCVKLCQKINELLDQFHQDPQLLDPHLRSLLPPLVQLYLGLIARKSFVERHHATIVVVECTAKILYQFCKVRGDKVVARFLNNEPQQVEPVIRAYDVVCNNDDQSNSQVAQLDRTEFSWEQQYILLLWMGHLMLIPFDLATVSSEVSTSEVKAQESIDLPPELPKVAVDSLQYALTSLGSAARVQKPASVLLVRLGIRQDLRVRGVLDALILWALSHLRRSQEEPSNVHMSSGLLYFLSSLMSLANINDIGRHVQAIYETIRNTFDEANAESPKLLASSNINKRLAIKIQRNVVIQVLKIQQYPDAAAHAVSQQLIDDLGLVEEVIDALLNWLSDRETQVRSSASKALSLITLHLEDGLALEVINAVIESLSEDILTEGGQQSFIAVNAQRWHGLILSLSHMLFRRSPTPSQLPAVLKALYSALSFEQRSLTGTSIGGNVRDAANFGLWSLARRYRTMELSQVEANELQISSISRKGQSAIEHTAINLIVSACLDPVGNVRRGSSAALQELVGRHPDMVEHGISLVQIVEYSAVGLRQRAMCGVSLEVAKLSDKYRDAIWDGLQSWRGTKAGDADSRRFAANSLGSISRLYDPITRQEAFQQCTDLLKATPFREVHERHGLLLAISAIIAEQADILKRVPDLTAVADNWQTFAAELDLNDRILAQSSRADLLIEGSLALTDSLLDLDIAASSTEEPSVSSEYQRPRTNPDDQVLNTLLVCFSRCPELALHLVDLCVDKMSKTMETGSFFRFMESCISQLKQTLLVSRSSGLMTALGAALRETHSESQNELEKSTWATAFKSLMQRASEQYEVEMRVIALRCLTSTMSSRVLPSLPRSTEIITDTLSSIYLGLNDYTINERGDIGSLLRIEALASVGRLWPIIQTSQIQQATECVMSVYRLLLEKMDNVRLHAAKCLNLEQSIFGDEQSRGSATFTGQMTIVDVTNYSFFFAHLSNARTRTPTHIQTYVRSDNDADLYLHSILEGIVTTAGAGNDSALPAARSALHDFLCMLPVEVSTEPGNGSASLVDVGNALIALLSRNTGCERVLVPLIETIGFLLDAGVLKLLEATTFKWRTLLSNVQKAHFKSSSIPKLLAAVNVYRGLLQIEAVRDETMKKLCSMIGHAFPKVRVAAAEALWIGCGDIRLKGRNWSGPIQSNKTTAQLITKSQLAKAAC